MPTVKYKVDCSFFDFTRTCTEVTGTESTCGNKPVLKDTGLCLFHTHGDHSHDMEWVDCYPGCIKHDPVVRKQHIERLSHYGENDEKRAERLAKRRARDAKKREEALAASKVTPTPRAKKKHAKPFNPVPVPSISRLYLMVANRDSDDDANTALAKKLDSLVTSRAITTKTGLNWKNVAKGLGLNGDLYSARLRKWGNRTSIPTFTFVDVVRICEFIREWDKGER